MPTLVVENIPEKLYELLERSARLNKRSLEDEVIACIRGTVGAQKIDRRDVETEIARARELREKTRGIWLTDDEINAAKQEGRP